MVLFVIIMKYICMLWVLVFLVEQLHLKGLFLKLEKLKTRVYLFVMNTLRVRTFTEFSNVWP